MKPLDATQLLPRPVWDDPRIHLLDDIWLLTVFVILIAIGVPWLVSGFELSMAAASLGLLALGAIHLALTGMAASTQSPTRWRRRAATALHVGGVVIIGVIWQHAGGVQNPAFLLVFALPVIGAIFLSRWHSYLTAVVAVLVVATVALLQIPELRWYASGLSRQGAWIAGLFAADAGSFSAPFSGFYAPSRYFIVLLQVFAILLFACAAVAEYLGTIFERLSVNIRAAHAEADRGQDLWTTLIEQLPRPALLVDADSSLIMCASERAKATFGGDDARIEGRKLFDAVQLSYPEILQELLRGEDGVIPQAVVRLAEDFLVAHITVQHLARNGRRFALVLIDDDTQGFCVKAALDAAEHAALVIDERGRLLAFNKPASGLFSSLSIGSPASRLLPDHAATWWDPGGVGRRKMHVTLVPLVYQVTSSAVRLPGEDARIIVVAFLPVAKAALELQKTGDTTMVTPTLVRTR